MTPSTRSTLSESLRTRAYSVSVTDTTRSSSSSADEGNDANTLCVPSPLSLGGRTLSASSIATASTAIDEDAPLCLGDMKTPATMALLELCYDPRSIDNRRRRKAARQARENDAAKSQVTELKAKSKTGTWGRRLKHARSLFLQA
jgi:hypothetical protein